MITKSKVKRKHSCKSDFHTPHIDSGYLMCEYYNVCGSRQELTKNKQKKQCESLVLLFLIVKVLLHLPMHVFMAIILSSHESLYIGSSNIMLKVHDSSIEPCPKTHMQPISSKGRVL